MSVAVVDLGTFSRQWAVEGRRIAWLFGAGASASAQVPTAGRVVLDLLSRLYADAHHLVHQDLNLGDEDTRRSILAYYDGINGMPPIGDPSDYSTVGGHEKMPAGGHENAHARPIRTAHWRT